MIGGTFLPAKKAIAVETTNQLGAIIWKANLLRPIVSSAAIAPDGTVYVTALNNSLTAFDHEGRKLWSFRTRSDIKSSPAVGDDGTIYFGSRDGKLYAVTPE